MTVQVLLFARARELAGRETVTVDLRDGASVAELRHALAEAAPALGPLLRTLYVAVNSEYAADADAIPPGAEVACFPPVSGG